MPDKKTIVDVGAYGVEMDLAQLQGLHSLLSGEGADQFRRIINIVKLGALENTLGANSACTRETFLSCHGEYQLAVAFSELQENVEIAIAELKA